MTYSFEGTSPCGTTTLTITTTASVPPSPRRQDPSPLYFLWPTATALAGPVVICTAATTSQTREKQTTHHEIAGTEALAGGTYSIR